MPEERYLLKLDTELIEKLPYKGPLTKRIYIIIYEDDKKSTQELFVQRFEAFTTDILGVINRLKNDTINEIRYQFGLSGLIQIRKNEKGQIVGEFSTKSKQEFDNFKRKMNC